MTHLLEVENVTKMFGGLRANHDVSMHLSLGELHCMIGPNGAGKTTFISMISGHHTPTSGTIRFEGQDVTGDDLVERAKRGIIRKFQNPSLYMGLTVWENVEIAAIASAVPHAERGSLIEGILRRVRLSDESDRPVDHLAHGQRQWLEIGLLLGRRAKLMLLDEPTAGMTTEETDATGQLIRELVAEENITAIVIEHDMDFVRQLGAPTTVLHLGEIIASGTYAEIEADEFVNSVYLGE